MSAWPPVFEARPAKSGVAWEVWDIEHPAECNHFPVLLVDSRGAADDFHEEYARICVTALNSRFAQGAAMFRKQEAAMLAELQRDPKGDAQ